MSRTILERLQWPDGEQMVQLHRDAAAEIDRLTSAVLARQAAGWQPIETAPKDGTDILTFQKAIVGPSARIRVGRHWAGKVWQESYSGQRTWPTHWMPLPAPPGQEQPPSQAVADAYRRGQDDMREIVAEFVVGRLKEYNLQGSLDVSCDLLNTLRSAIRALPAKEQP